MLYLARFYSVELKIIFSGFCYKSKLVLNSHRLVAELPEQSAIWGYGQS